jgi:hypothetical protein
MPLAVVSAFRGDGAAKEVLRECVAIVARVIQVSK